MNQFTKDHPSYIPQHLKGSVGDFKRDDNGMLSFMDATTGERKTLSAADEDATFNISHLTTTAPGLRGKMYGSTDPRPARGLDKLITGAGNMTGNVLRGIQKTTGTDLALGGGATIAALLAAKYLRKKNLLEKGESEEEANSSGWKWGLGSAAATAAIASIIAHKTKDNVGAGAYLNKTASSSSVIRALQSDPSLSFSQRADLLRAINRLDYGDLTWLERNLGSMYGVGVGAAISKFLMGKGLLGTAIGGLIGGVFGSIFNPSPTYDAYGRISAQQ